MLKVKSENYDVALIISLGPCGGKKALHIITVEKSHFEKNYDLIRFRHKSNSGFRKMSWSKETMLPKQEINSSFPC